MIKLVRYTENLAPNGDFLTVEDMDAIIDAIVKTLSIPRGTYIGDPEVGSELYKYLFDLSDEMTIENIKAEVEYSLDQIEDLYINAVNVLYTNDRKGVIIEIDALLYQKISKRVSIIATNEYVSLLDVN